MTNSLIMKVIIIGIELFLINHMSVTLFRVYLRQEKLKNYYVVNPEMLGFSKGLERRIFKPTTFVFATILTSIELLSIIIAVL